MKDVYTISNEESQRIEIMKVIMCFGVCFVHSYSDRVRRSGLLCVGGWGVKADICSYLFYE